MMTGWAEAGMVDAVTNLALATMVAAAALALIRLIKGPTLPDRVIALDLIAILVVGAIVTCAVKYESPVLMQPAIALALLAFLSTVAFARYVQKRAAP